jgi:hypothetical protein
VSVRLCKNPACRKPLDPGRVEKHNALTRDDRCRAAAWKLEVNYGRGKREGAVRTARKRAPELRVSYQKTLDVLSKRLAQYLMATGISERQACEELAEVLAEALTPRQLERLQERNVT